MVINNWMKVKWKKVVNENTDLSYQVGAISRLIQPSVVLRTFLVCMVLQMSLLTTLVNLFPVASAYAAFQSFQSHARAIAAQAHHQSAHPQALGGHSGHATVRTRRGSSHGGVHTIPHDGTYSVSGTAFNDSNENGIQDVLSSGSSPPRNELGIAGVTVTAYDSSNTVVGSAATTDAQGNYSLSIPTGTTVRVQFSGYGTGSVDPVLQRFRPSIHHMTAGSSVENTTTNFVSDTATVNQGLIRPEQYCQDNPNVAVGCYVYGASNGDNAAGGVLVEFPYASTGTDSHTALATNQQLGSIQGLAYRRSTPRKLFHKRQVLSYSGTPCSCKQCALIPNLDQPLSPAPSPSSIPVCTKRGLSTRRKPRAPLLSPSPAAQALNGQTIVSKKR